MSACSWIGSGGLYLCCSCPTAGRINSVARSVVAPSGFACPIGNEGRAVFLAPPLDQMAQPFFDPVGGPACGWDRRHRRGSKLLGHRETRCLALRLRGSTEITAEKSNS